MDENESEKKILAESSRKLKNGKTKKVKYTQVEAGHAVEEVKITDN